MLLRVSVITISLTGLMIAIAIINPELFDSMEIFQNIIQCDRLLDESVYVGH